MRQRVLTVGIEAWGSVLDALQRLVDLEHVGDVLCPINTKIILRDAANENRIAASTAIDTWQKGEGATYLSSTNVEFVFSASAICAAPSACSPLFWRLRTRIKSSRQRLLTVGKRQVAAYSRLWSVLLTLSASETCLAPSAPRLLYCKLPTRVESRRQRLLTLAMARARQHTRAQ